MWHVGCFLGSSVQTGPGRRREKPARYGHGDEDPEGSCEGIQLEEGPWQCCRTWTCMCLLLRCHQPIIDLLDVERWVCSPPTASGRSSPHARSLPSTWEDLSGCLLPQDNALSPLPAVDHPVWLRKLYVRPRRPPAAAGSVSLPVEAPPPSLVHLTRDASAQQALLGRAVAPTARVSMHKHTSLAFKAVLFPLAGVDGPKITFQMLQLVLVSPAL